MQVDQARQRRVAAKVNDLRPFRHVALARADLHDAVAFDDDDRVVDQRGAVPEVSDA